MSYELTLLDQQVIKQLGYEPSDINTDDDLDSMISDIANYGIDGGFTGFIEYNDTVAFFDNNRELIIQSLIEFADDCGESVSDMVKTFRYLKDMESTIDCVLMNVYCVEQAEEISVKNSLSWFAAENTCSRLFYLA